MAKRIRCVCGNVMSKWAHKCKKCAEKAMSTSRALAIEIVIKGTCPDCGSKLVRNNALSGWWQCVQFGTWKESHGDPNKDNCSFQCFTE